MTPRSEQVAGSSTAPQGNVTQASHKYVTKQSPSSPSVTQTSNSGEADLSTDTQALAVTKTVTVNATAERAFTVFTAKFVTWWPKSHHIGKADLADAIIEPKVGGRWYERGTDGSECDWGVVLAYEPPARVAMSWHLQGDWSYDPDPAKASEVEVRFIAESESRTRVELTHRHIERHDMAEKVVAGIDSPGGWNGILDDYVVAIG